MDCRICLEVFAEVKDNYFSKLENLNLASGSPCRLDGPFNSIASIKIDPSLVEYQETLESNPLLNSSYSDSIFVNPSSHNTLSSQCPAVREEPSPPLAEQASLHPYSVANDA